MKKRKGFALILTLSVIVLLTGLLLSLLSLTTNKRIQTKSATESMRVNALARGAADHVSSIFVTQLKERSEVFLQESAGPNSRAIYKPVVTGVKPFRAVHPKLTTQWNADSQKWTNPNYLNLIRQSLPNSVLTGKEDKTQGANVVSNIRTSETLDPSTWNKIQLTIGSFEEDTAPHWIYVDREGNSHTGANARFSDQQDERYVVGRYAYNVYNVGGLLDVNTAGASPSLFPLVASRKGSPFSLDITKIPGFDSASATQLNTFFEWRDNTLNADTIFDVEGVDNASEDGYIAAAGKKGWLSPVANSANNRNSNRFISRSDLITSLNELLGTENASKALPHLSTENRFVERPNHIPDDGIPQVKYGLDDGGSDADQFPTANNGTWALVDGKVTSLLPSRFPLDRIALFSNPEGNAGEIEQYFGLRAEGGYWRYVHQNSDEEILTLDRVAELDRAPNFFEILKAAIHSGSLGIQHGNSTKLLTDEFLLQSGTSGREILPFTIESGRDGIIDFQIVKIAANIIDQYDSDSYPTVVDFTNNGGNKYIAGVEAIPQIYTLQANVFVEEALTGVLPIGFNYDNGGPKNWSQHGALVANKVLQPRLWNPNVAERINPAQTPTKFKIQAELLPNLYAPFCHIQHSSDNEGYRDAEGNITSKGWIFRDYGDLRAEEHLWHNEHTSVNEGADYQKGLNWPSRKRWNFNAIATFHGIDDDHNYGPGLEDNPASKLKNDLSYEYTLQPTANWPYTFSDPRTLTASNYPSSKLTISATEDTTFRCIQDIMRPGFNQSGNISGYDTLDNSESHNVVGFPIGKFWMGPAVQKKEEDQLIEPMEKLVDASAIPRFPVMFQRLYCYGQNLKLNLFYEDQSGNWVQFDEKFYFGAMIHDEVTSKGWNQQETTKVAVSSAVKYLRNTFYFDPRDNRWGPILARANPVVFVPENDREFSNLVSWKEGRSIQYGDEYFVEPITWATQEGGLPYDEGNKLFTVDYNKHESTLWNWNRGTTNPAGVAFNNATSPYSYIDPDGVKRSPMGKYWAAGSFEGQPMAAANPEYADEFQEFDEGDIYSTSKTSEIVRQNRPIILNRPFHSVGELGYVFSGTPWRNLDFFTVESGDKHLLEYFCLHAPEGEKTVDGSPIVGGKVDINSASTEVVESMLSSAGRDYSTEDVLNQSPLLDEGDIARLAETIVSYTHHASYRPLFSKADLVGYYDGRYRGLSDELGKVFPSLSDDGGHDFRNKNRREAVVRSLASLGGVGTWNLVVDLVAEVGSIKKGSPELQDFVTRAQSHIWLHLTIDRFTGEVIHHKIEQAY